MRFGIVLLAIDSDTGFLTRLPRHYAAARRSYADEIVAAGREFANSFSQSRLWTVLATHDIAARYRGSILGPFWITLAQFVFVGSIGLVYGDLMHVSTEKYVPWMATGVTMWTLISGVVNEGSDSFVHASVIIRQTSIPLPLFVWRVVFRNLLNFAHQIVVVLVVAIWFHYWYKINLLLFAAGFILVVVNISWMSFVAAIVAARFRDVQQAIATGMQLLFFISPVIWIPNDMNGIHGNLLRANPVYHMMEVTRAPLLGHPVDPASYGVLLIMAVAGWAFTFGLYAAVRRRIVHYL